MKILILIIKNATQAKLILKPGFAIIKIPAFLTKEKQLELRNKLIKVADLNSETQEFLKLYYRIGSPYLFLNRKVSYTKRETFVTYPYNEL